MNNVSNNKIAMAMRAIAGFVSLCIGEKAKIAWGREAACDRFGVIYLPRPKTGDADEVAILSRRALHEAGHHHHTDFSKLEGISADVAALLNALEDSRIEREQVRKYPGASLILNRGLAEALETINGKLDPENPEHKASLVVINVFLKGMLELAPHRAVQERSGPIVAKGDHVLGDQGVAAVNEAVDRLKAASSTNDALEVATELWNLLNPPEPPQPPSEQQESDDQGEDESSRDQSQEQSGSGSQPESEDADPNASDRAADNTGQADAQAQQADSQGGGEKSEDQGSSQGQKDNEPSSGQAQPPHGQSSGGDPDARNDDQKGESGEQQPTQGGAGSSGQSGTGQSPQEASGQAGQVDGTADNSQPGNQNSSGNPQSQKLDLSSEKSTDLGKLLGDAYEAKFGKPDVDPQDEEVHVMESDDDMAVALAKALEQADINGESLEEALEQAQAILAAIDGEPDDGNPHAPQGGFGGATGEVIKLDQEIRMSGVVSRLVRVFTKELQDKRRRPVKFAPAGGQVAGNRVWRLKRLGDLDVFRVKAPVTGIDAAVLILLDRSGSMEKDIVCAAEVSLACSQALERISRVKTSIEMFPAEEGVPSFLETLQTFGESARQVAKRTAGILAGGGTPLAGAIQQAMPKLMSQRVQKRVMIIVTDGGPNDPPGAIAAIATARQMGVEVMGIGIGLEGKAIQGLVPYSVCISTASELPGALEKLFNSQMAEKLAA